MQLIIISRCLETMNCTLAERIQNHLVNLSKLIKDLDFYQEKQLLFKNFENLKMDSKWDGVFSSTSRFANGSATSNRKIVPKPVYQEYNIGDIVQIIYNPEKTYIVLHNKNDTSIQLTYNEFEEFLQFFDNINDGWSDTSFYIGEFIYVSYWNEEESKGLTMVDKRTMKNIYWNENHLDSILEHKYNLYDIFLK